MTNYIVTEEQLTALQDCFTDATACMDYMSLARGRHTQKFAEILEAIKSEPEEASVCGWSAEDMRTACQMHGFTISDKDAGHLLQSVVDDSDANEGVNWNSIWENAQDMRYAGAISLLEYTEEGDQ